MTHEEILEEVEQISKHLGCNKDELLTEFLKLFNKIITDEDIN